jgi:hypothetical protein
LIIYVWKHLENSCPNDLIGASKIGEADETKSGYENLSIEQIARKRIEQYTKTAGVNYELLYYGQHNCTDKQVHEKLSQRGIRRIVANNTGDEWFPTQDLNEIKSAIIHAETGKYFGPDRTLTYKPRPLSQDKAIDFLLNLKNTGHKKALINAKCRFGKTVTSYWFAKQAKCKSVLIMSYMPGNVKSSWRNDCQKHLDFANFDFYDQNEEPNFKTNNTVVQFCSFQYAIESENEELEDEINEFNLRTTRFLKEKIANKHWDLLIIDEDHYGAKGSTGREFISKINSDFNIYLTGTATQEITSGEFSPEEIYQFTYIDEQKLKSHPDINISSQYADMPEMIMHQFFLPQMFEAGDVPYSLEELFSTHNENGHQVFKYENNARHDISEFFLRLLGNKISSSLGQKTGLAIYDNLDLKCGLLVLPEIKSCRAVRNLFKNNRELNSKFELIPINLSVIENGTRTNKKGQKEKKYRAPTLEEVNNSINKAIENNKIALLATVNRFCTGATIPMCDHILFCKPCSSESMYWQTNYRAGSPGKEKFHVFDFEPNRIITMCIDDIQASLILKRKSIEEGSTDLTEAIKEYFNFVPIINHETASYITLPTDIILGDYSKFQRSYFKEPKTYKNELAKKLAKLVLKFSVKNPFDFDNESANIASNKKEIGTDSKVVKPTKTGSGGSSVSDKKVGEKKNLKETEEFIISILDSLFWAYIYGNGNLTLHIYKDSLNSKEYNWLYQSQNWCNDVISFLKDNPDFSVQLEREFFFLKENRADIYETLENMMPNRITDESDKNRYKTPQKLAEVMISKLGISDWKTAKIIEPTAFSGEFLKECLKRGANKVNLFAVTTCKKLAVIIAFNVWGDWTLFKDANKIAIFEPSQLYIKEMDPPKITKNFDEEKFDKQCKEYYQNNTIYLKVKRVFDMNFKYAIMNPPYGNLHLPILKKITEEIVDKNDGTVISLQPVRWLQDPCGEFKPKEGYAVMKPTLENKINSIDIITAEEACELFKPTRIIIDLGIFCIKNNGKTEYDSLFPIKANYIIKKLIRSKNSVLCSDVSEENKIKGWRVYWPSISSYYGKDVWQKKNMVFFDGYDKQNNFWGQPPYINNQYRKPIGTPMGLSIPFKTELEAVNFVKSMQTKIMVFLMSLAKIDVNIYLNWFPYMVDYTQPWTSERFYKFFNLTDEEISTIENWAKENGIQDC